MRNATIGLLALAFTLAIAGPAPAQDPAPAAQNQNTETKNLRKEIVRLKYVRADQIGVILNSYTSREGHVQYQNNLPFVLSVIDTPENVEKILAAIREIDVKPSDVLYTVQLVLGSEADATTDAELKNDPIVKELGKLLRYKGYTLLDATLVRTVNMDNAEVKFGPKAEFALELRPVVAGDPRAPVIKTTVRLRQTVLVLRPVTKMDGTETTGVASSNIVTLIESSLNIKSGDRTVVGVSKLDGGDKGLILIISGKIVD